MTNATKLILVGGFLGAGKTTMLSRLANILANRDVKVGLVSNDQATDLVDTAVLTKTGCDTKEVSGSCFCCNFLGFEAALRSLKEKSGVDIIIAEPVGSCTDLSATILQPLKDKYKNDYDLAAFSVLVDPKRLAEILAGGDSGLHASSAYIVRKQLEEADMIVINKCDLLTPAEAAKLTEAAAKAYPQAKVFCVSAQEGANVESWLDAVLSSTGSGKNLTEVDYDIYAEGEAVLGWFNADITLSGHADWNALLSKYVNALAERFASKDQAIGHLKVLMSDAAGDTFAVANLTSGKDAIRIRGEVAAGPEAQLIVNARVEMSPEELEEAIFQVLDAACGDAVQHKVVSYKCLMPGRPAPTYHYDQVI
ncbi:MAG: cobalamin synthesis protein P47K [Firmicutes bacterium]|nr:cobalamin synthesis protein P47K [Bacillota bacterium]